MGRTLMPFSFVLEDEEGMFEKFKELSKEDKEAFDRLFDPAKFRTSPAVYMAHPWPRETILLDLIGK